MRKPAQNSLVAAPSATAVSPCNGASTRFLDQILASRFLWEECGVKVAPMTLKKLRCVGGGPPFRKAFRRVTYESDALKFWGDCQRSPIVTNTGELPRGGG